MEKNNPERWGECRGTQQSPADTPAHAVRRGPSPGPNSTPQSVQTSVRELLFHGVCPLNGVFRVFTVRDLGQLLCVVTAATFVPEATQEAVTVAETVTGRKYMWGGG